MSISASELISFKESKGLEFEEVQVFTLIEPVWACTSVDRVRFSDPYEVVMLNELLIWANESK